MQEGLAMGSPLSGLLAEIFLDELESEFFSDKFKLFTKNIKAYFRYVDDIFVIHEGNDANIIALHTILNNLSKLQFTIERENNNSINFLDVHITKNNLHKRLSYDIFRKPTNTDVIIPYLSNSPPAHKEAAFRFLINRANNMPLNNKQYQTELNYIANVGKRNGYNINYIQGIYNKIHNNNIIKQIYPHKKSPVHYISIPYDKYIYSTIKPILLKHDIQISYKANSNLNKILSNNKPKIPYTQKSGIYKLTCGNCEKYYVGQTGRSLKDRFQDHISRNNSNMYRHLTMNKHLTSIDNMQLLHEAPKSFRLNLLEEMEIEKHHKRSPELMLNEITYSTGTHLFSKFI